jgi:hypothetical protein
MIGDSRLFIYVIGAPCSAADDQWVIADEIISLYIEIPSIIPIVSRHDIGYYNY